jgi:uncharacterized protein YbjT (DUF2867 family)
MDLVSGGTGRIGRHVVHGLLRQKAAVRALVRDAGRARAVLGPDVELVEGDLDDPSSLARAAAGARSVLILSSHHPRQAEQQRNLLRAAQAADAERLVKVSGINATIRPDAPSPVSQAHWRTEQDTRASRGAVDRRAAQLLHGQHARHGRPRPSPEPARCCCPSAKRPWRWSTSATSPAWSWPRCRR